MKKTISFILCVVLSVSLFAGTAFAAESLDNFSKVNTYQNGLFNDVPSGQWFTENVKNAYELDLMQGKGAGSFGINDSISYAETVAMAARIHSIYYTGSASFTQGDPWYAVYYDYAVDNKIISDRQYLNATDPASRYDFADILSGALPTSALSAINTVEAGAIPDVVFESAAHVYLLYRAGVLTGRDEKGSFAPWENIQRSEVSAIVSRMALPSLRREFTLTVGGNTGGEGGAAAEYIRQAYNAVEQANKALLMAHGANDALTAAALLNQAVRYIAKAVEFAELALENTDNAKATEHLGQGVLACREAASTITKMPNNVYTKAAEYLNLASEYFKAALAQLV